MSNPFTAGASPSIGSSLLSGLLNSNPEAAQVASALGIADQSFQTIPVRNTRLALYTLSIRTAGSPFVPYASYTFPISPAAIAKEYTSLTNIYDVQGSPSQSGVKRIADIYGNSPVTFVIEGTTGWKMHATDAYAWTGLESIKYLQQMLQTYAELNQTQSNNNQPLYTLEFYDYFTGDFWQVEPVGRQEIRQSRDRPQLVNYSFRLAGISNLNNPLQDLIDTFSQVIDHPVQQAASIIGSAIGGVLNNYINVTPGSLSLPAISRFF